MDYSNGGWNHQSYHPNSSSSATVPIVIPTETTKATRLHGFGFEQTTMDDEMEDHNQMLRPNATSRSNKRSFSNALDKEDAVMGAGGDGAGTDANTADGSSGDLDIRYFKRVRVDGSTVPTVAEADVTSSSTATTLSNNPLPLHHPFYNSHVSSGLQQVGGRFESIATPAEETARQRWERLSTVSVDEESISATTSAKRAKSNSSTCSNAFSSNHQRADAGISNSMLGILRLERERRMNHQQQQQQQKQHVVHQNLTNINNERHSYASSLPLSSTHLQSQNQIRGSGHQMQQQAVPSWRRQVKLQSHSNLE